MTVFSALVLFVDGARNLAIELSSFGLIRIGKMEGILPIVAGFGKLGKLSLPAR